MSDQFPPGEEPTRMNPQGGSGPQEPQGPQQWGPPQQPQPPQQWGPPPQQPGQQQSGQQQSGQWGQQPQQPGQWGQQPGQGQQWGQPDWNQQQWGQQPAPYGGQGGAGWGGPTNPYDPSGQAGPPNNNKKNALLVAGIVAVVLLIVGGIGAAIALGGDDDEDDPKAGGDTSQTAEPTEEPTDGATDDPTQDPTDAPTAPSTDASPDSGGSFTAEYQRDLAQVCTGAAMSNAKPFDPATAKVTAFLDSPKDEDWSGYASVGINEKFEARYDEFLDVTMVACVSGTPSASVEPQKCESKDNDGKKVTYTYAPYDYQPVYREAATGQVLFEGTLIEPPFDDCPMFAFIDSSGEYTPSADSDSMDEDIKEWLKQQ